MIARLPQSQLPGSRWLAWLRNATLRVGLLTGIYLSIVCSEEIPKFDAAAFPAAAAGTLPELRGSRDILACGEWVRGSLPPDHWSPVASDVPRSPRGFLFTAESAAWRAGDLLWALGLVGPASTWLDVSGVPEATMARAIHLWRSGTEPAAAAALDTLGPRARDGRMALARSVARSSREEGLRALAPLLEAADPARVHSRAPEGLTVVRRPGGVAKRGAQSRLAQRVKDPERQAAQRGEREAWGAPAGGEEQP